jgi:hypothetical protein
MATAMTEYGLSATIAPTLPAAAAVTLSITAEPAPISVMPPLDMTRLTAVERSALERSKNCQKRCDLSGFTIHVDCREGRGALNLSLPVMAECLHRASGAKVVCEPLVIADFWLTDAEGHVLCMMERKTGADLEGSIKSGHMNEQLERWGKVREMEFDGKNLPADPTLPFMGLAFVGNWMSVNEEFSVALSGVMSNAQCAYSNFSVLPVQSEAVLPTVLAGHFSRLVLKIDGQHHGFGAFPLLNEVKRTCKKSSIKSHDEWAVAALSLIHGTGPEKATMIAAKYDNSLWEVMRQTKLQGTAAFTGLPGIGEGTARKYVEAIADKKAKDAMAAQAYAALHPPPPPAPEPARRQAIKKSHSGSRRRVVEVSSDEEEEDGDNEYDYNDRFLANDDESLGYDSDAPVLKTKKKLKRRSRAKKNAVMFIDDDVEVGEPRDDEGEAARRAARRLGLSTAEEDDEDEGIDVNSQDAEGEEEGASGDDDEEAQEEEDDQQEGEDGESAAAAAALADDESSDCMGFIIPSAEPSAKPPTKRPGK